MERSPEIEGALRRFVLSVATGDLDAILGFHSEEPGLRVIGTDPKEWYSDGDVVALWKAQVPELAAVGTSVNDLEVEGFEEGRVGWGAATFLQTVGPVRDVRARVTAVFRLERAHWQVVQLHASIGVANEDAIAVELTTTFDAVADAVRENRPELGVPAAPDGTVTLLFTDIEASTVLAERLGDDRWTRLLRWHRTATDEAARANRGYVVKSLGDGFMIAFPSASDGIRCAIELQRRVDEGWEGEFIRIRTGLHSGDAVRDLDDFYGHAVTVAARVAALAHGGEILVTRVVRELAHGAGFEFGTARVTELKGLDGTYEVIPVLT
jgi:class 3 adenylate cyclase